MLIICWIKNYEKDYFWNNYWVIFVCSARGPTLPFLDSSTNKPECSGILIKKILKKKIKIKLALLFIKTKENIINWSKRKRYGFEARGRFTLCKSLHLSPPHILICNKILNFLFCFKIIDNTPLHHYKTFLCEFSNRDNVNFNRQSHLLASLHLQQ